VLMIVVYVERNTRNVGREWKGESFIERVWTLSMETYRAAEVVLGYR